MTSIRVLFNRFACTPTFHRYADGDGIAIRLVDVEDGSPVATATVNSTVPVPVGCVAIKDWSENAGMLAACLAAGLVADTGVRIRCDFASAPLCRLLAPPELLPAPRRSQQSRHSRKSRDGMAACPA